VRRFQTLESLAADLGQPPYLAIGTFDGVHLGHRAVIGAMVRSARAAAAPAVVLTFLPHPLAVIRPAHAPPLLADFGQRARLLEALGIEGLVELPFTPALAAVTPAVFVQEYLCRRAQARRAFVGADFTFGARAKGTAESLAVLGRQACGLETTVVPLRMQGGGPISSTRIRQALGEGRPGEAARLLGRAFTMSGVVVPGERRGRTLGFPTANLALDGSLAQPMSGVYAVRCSGGEAAGPGVVPRWRPGVANFGVRPTVGGQDQRLEVHLFDFDGDLYGLRLEVALLRRLRGERRFPNVAALRRQIALDCARARQLQVDAADPDQGERAEQ